MILLQMLSSRNKIKNKKFSKVVAIFYPLSARRLRPLRSGMNCVRITLDKVVENTIIKSLEKLQKCSIMKSEKFSNIKPTGQRSLIQNVRTKWRNERKRKSSVF